MANRRIPIFLLALFGLFIYEVWAKSTEKTIPLAQLSPADIQERVQSCAAVQSMNEEKRTTAPEVSAITTRMFDILFPGSAAINSLLATAYISGPPNFLLALCPPNIDPSSLSVMIAFAFGGLMGDTLFHLLPEIFLGEDEPHRLTFVMIEPNRNLILGVFILVGFVTFVILDKTLRIATGGAGHEHKTDDLPSSSLPDEKTALKATGISTETGSGSVKSRKSNTAANGTPTSTSHDSPSTASSSISAQAFLPLLADFTHNITDGLALSSSFYSSPTLGATTTLAVFFHEIPHEVGDFALLIQSGFSKQRAMGAQFVTAIGAFLGTFIGIFIQEMGSGGSNASVASGGATVQAAKGLWGTSLQAGDLLLPFTAGTFLYVGTVAVVPELLETGPDKKKEIRSFVTQLLAMAAGAGIMLGISWA